MLEVGGGVDEEEEPPPEQVFCWRSSTACASAGQPEMMHMVAELTKGLLQMQATSQGPEHLASPRALVRQF